MSTFDQAGRPELHSLAPSRTRYRGMGDTARRAAPARLQVQARSGSISGDRAGGIFLVGDLVAIAATLTAWDQWNWMGGLFALLLLGGLLANHLYTSRFTMSVLDDAPRLFGTTLLAAALVAILVSMVAGSVAFGNWLPVLVAPAAVLAGRTLTYATVRRLRMHHRLTRRALIIGAGMVGQDLALQLRGNAAYGLDPVGFIDDSPLISGTASAAPVLGGSTQLAEAITQNRVHEVLVAFTSASGDAMVDVLRTADRLNCEVSVVPRLFELGLGGRATDEINGVPLIRLRRGSFRSRTWPLKRVLDVLLSAAALVLLSPLLAAVALALRVTEGPGVIFKQPRIGLDGREFVLLKFRSLRPVDDTESSTKWSIKDDQRMSRLGKLLRRSSIDELPQLWNILRGDMSLVGPRPERPYFVQTFGEAFPRYGARHRVPCGLTGWAQIHGLRGDTSIEERARFDNYYIENWSLWLDVKIILRTALSLTRGSC